MSALKEWSLLRPDQIEKRNGAEAHIAEELEWWLSGALSYNPVRHNQGWWSDGIVYLALRQLDELAICAAGVTIWADSDARREFIAPFEAEFYFKSQLWRRFARTVVRFGVREGVNGIYRVPYGSSPPYDSVYNERPTCDSDWAVAIEISGD